MHYWNIHTGEAIQEQVEPEGFVGVGWKPIGNVAGLSRDEIRARMDREYVDVTPRGRAQWTSMLYRFANDMAVGDVVVTSLKAPKQVLTGHVSSSYHHAPGESEYPNTRSVRWDKKISRYELSAELRASMATSLVLTSLDGYVEEIDRFITGEHLADDENDDDETDTDDEETDADRADTIEAEAFERIFDRLYADFDEYEFEELVADLLKALGFTTQGRAAPGPDGGVDIVATTDALRLDPARIKVQVKHRRTAASAPEVQQLAGTLHGQERGLFVSLGGFTQQAYGVMASVSLMDGEELVRLLLEHYERLNTRAQARLPLRRVYLPT